MFVDEITIKAKAGRGGDGVTRWRHEKFKPRSGPAGGNGGRGGSVYARAVRDVNVLAKYTGAKKFEAGAGEAGQGKSRFGKNGDDLYIDVPVGSVLFDLERDRRYELLTEGETVRLLKGGAGGIGNEEFKSSTNRSPEESTKGRPGEVGNFRIEVSLVVDVGIIGSPNAGKSTLLNTLTNAHSKVGAYPFTTLDPHLGDFYGFVLADIPGLMAGAATGKGLGHRFLKHVSRTKMLLHLVSLDQIDPIYTYYTIRTELSNYDKSLSEKEEWIIFTKSDLANKEFIETVKKNIDKIEKRVFFISAESGEGIKELSDSLVSHLRTAYNK